MERDKLDKLNELEVVDWDCDGVETIYVHVEDTPENREILIELGATAEQIEEMVFEHYGELDITRFAFEELGAAWYMPEKGFGKEHENNFFEVGNAMTLQDLI